MIAVAKSSQTIQGSKLGGAGSLGLPQISAGSQKMYSSWA